MSTQKAATPQPLLQAIDLKKHYPVKKGLFAPERLVKALDASPLLLSAVKRWRWWESRAAVNRPSVVC